MMKKKKIIFTSVLLLIGLTFSVSATTINTINKEDVIFLKSEIDENITLISLECKDSIELDVLYEFEDGGNLENYKNRNTQNLSTLELTESSYDFIGTVTFNRPLSIIEFYEVIDEFNLVVFDFKIRALDESGNRVTIGGKLSDSIIDEDKLKRFLGNNSFMGVIACTLRIDEKNIGIIKRLNSNADIFTISSDTYFLRSGFEGKNKQIKFSPVIDVYWDLEDLRLEE